jgi:hypothetical protein
MGPVAWAGQLRALAFYLAWELDGRASVSAASETIPAIEAGRSTGSAAVERHDFDPAEQRGRFGVPLVNGAKECHSVLPD